MESGKSDHTHTRRVHADRLDVLAELEGRIRALGNWLIGAYPSLAPTLLRAWSAYVYLYIRSVALANSIKHEAHIEPFELFWINVDRIEFITGPLPNSKFKYVGKVAGGDWDRTFEPFEETDVYRAFEAHFEQGVEWNETAFFDRVIEQIEYGRAMWGCRSRQEFEDRCVELDELYRSIESHGYMTQAELAERDANEPIEKGRVTRIGRFIHDEMTVSVGRDGELLFNDGRDRLAIAKLLGLEEVPVWIMLRHIEWQRLRDDLATGEVDAEALSDDLRSHPDLQRL